MSGLTIEWTTLGYCATNTYTVRGKDSAGRDTDEVIYFDPADRGDLLWEKLQEKGLRVAAILLTHGHFDHIWGAEELRRLSGARIYAYRGEQALLADAGLNVSADMGRPCTIVPDELLDDNAERTFAGLRVQLIATPGHTGGSCCWYFPDYQTLLSGDTLFEGSVGRTDFPTGSMSDMTRSLRERLFLLPDETVVYPGHGGQTTIGYEKKYNPYA